MRRFCLSAIAQYFGVYIYILWSKIHWGPRKRAIVNILDKISEANNNNKYRIVDIGCGPGLLARVVKKRGFSYLGIDSNLNSIQYCQDVYSEEPDIEFMVNDFKSKFIKFSANDIIVLNGVAHHLDDFQMDLLLKKTSSCFAVIIADHLRKQPNISICNLLPFILQSLDRGRFIRIYKYFENFNNYNLIRSQEIPIYFAGITFWTYFCNVYKSNLK